MFDIDSGKLLIVAVLALIVIGPKELPRVLRQVGQSVGKLRRMAGEFQGQFMDAMKEADLADIRKDLEEINKSAALDVHFDPARDIQAELTTVMNTPVMASTAEAASPAAGFALPAASPDSELGSTGAGIAPVADAAEIDPAAEPATFDHAPTAPVLPDEPALAEGSTQQPAPFPHAKRRIALKRRTSRIDVMQSEAEANRTGAPFVVRRRTVRAKAVAAADLPTS